MSSLRLHRENETTVSAPPPQVTPLPDPAHNPFDPRSPDPFLPGPEDLLPRAWAACPQREALPSAAEQRVSAYLGIPPVAESARLMAQMDSGLRDPAAMAARAIDLYTACERETAARYARLAAEMDDTALVVLLRTLVTPDNKHAAMDFKAWEKKAAVAAARLPSAAIALEEYHRRREASRPVAAMQKREAWTERLTARHGDQFVFTHRTATTLDLVQALTPFPLQKESLTLLVQAMVTLEAAARRVRDSDDLPGVELMQAAQYVSAFQRLCRVPEFLAREAAASPLAARRKPLRDPFQRAWCFHLWQYFLALHVPAWLDSASARYRAAALEKTRRLLAAESRRPGGKARAAQREGTRYRTYTAAFRQWALEHHARAFSAWLRGDTGDPARLPSLLPKQPGMREPKGRNFLVLLCLSGHDPALLAREESALRTLEIPLSQSQVTECAAVLFGRALPATDDALDSALPAGS